MNKRGSSQQYLKNKKEILEDLTNKQTDRIQEKINENPVLKLGQIKPVGISLEMKMREIE